MSYGKIVFMGMTITITGAMLLIGLPLMFSALFYFIDKLLSILLFIAAIIILVLFVSKFLGK
ncbi:MAG: hypothetical protein KKG76_04685 [Euryarchaeota archaeon]|nr:hypothetical protein [Euryarchaeota archaeon]